MQPQEFLQQQQHQQSDFSAGLVPLRPPPPRTSSSPVKSSETLSFTQYYNPSMVRTPAHLVALRTLSPQKHYS